MQKQRGEAAAQHLAARFQFDRVERGLADQHREVDLRQFLRFGRVRDHDAVPGLAPPQYADDLGVRGVPDEDQRIPRRQFCRFALMGFDERAGGIGDMR